jgi:YVTN family beta-propeller protein
MLLRRPVPVVAAAFLVVAVGLALAATRLRPTPGVPLAYVANAGNNHVQVIDLTSGRSLRKIYAGVTPWRLVVSADRRQLCIQHWYSATTAVVDIADHEIREVIAARGPGLFTPGGDAFVSFDWPSSALRTFDARDFKLRQERVTDLTKVHDVAWDPGGKTLYLAQFDPMVKGPHERYGYVVAYPFAETGRRAAPISHRTGLSPARVQALTHAPFVLTADRETDGLSLVNALGDTRAIAACPAPQAIVLSEDETRVVVPCWRGEGAPTSQVVAYRADFGARPWPVFVEEKRVALPGALVAGAFSPGGERVYLLDRSGRRLRELDARTLETLRDFPTGDEPVDVAVVAVSTAARDRLSRESRGRRLLRDVLARMTARGRPVVDLAWTETARWKEAPPRTTGSSGAPEPVEHVRRSSVSFKAPDGYRTESEDGSLRLASGGHTLAVDPGGRFWVTPRQDVVSVLYALPSLSVDEAVRQLAGDVPGSPFLRSGIAVDLVTEVREETGRYYLVGATRGGEAVSQLWVDAATGRPTNLVEQFPLFRPRGHGPQDFGGLVETKFYDFAAVEGGLELPTRLTRTAGPITQDVRVTDLHVNAGIPDERFDLARLGGVGLERFADRFRLTPPRRPDSGPGRAVPVLEEPYLSPGHRRSTPPTTAARPLRVRASPTSPTGEFTGSRCRWSCRSTTWSTGAWRSSMAAPTAARSGWRSWRSSQPAASTSSWPRTRSCGRGSRSPPGAASRRWTGRTGAGSSRSSRPMPARTGMRPRLIPPARRRAAKAQSPSTCPSSNDLELASSVTRWWLLPRTSPRGL